MKLITKSKFRLYLVLGFLCLFYLSACSDFLNKSQTKDNNKNPQFAEKPNPSKNPFASNFEEPTVGAFTQEKLLLNIGLNVIAPLTKSFMQESQILNFRLDQTCQYSNQNSSTVFPQETKQQFEKVLSLYHQLDLLSIGPLSDEDAKTKLNIKSLVHSWPYYNHCAVDLAVYELSQTNQFPKQLAYNAYGLGQIEYLMYAPLSGVQCNLKARPQLKDWLEQTSHAKFKQRCEGAKALSQKVYEQAQTLFLAWDRDEFNFSKTLVDGSRFTNLKKALNAYTDSLYDLEKVKDERLGIPLGKSNKECKNQKCPEKREHVFSDLSFLSIKARLLAFKKGFFGDENFNPQYFGLDDLLVQNGYSQVSDKVKNLVLNAESQLNQIEQVTLKEQIEQMNLEQCLQTTSQNRIVPVCALFEDIRQITSTLKTEVLIILSLDAPPTYQGDND